MAKLSNGFPASLAWHLDVRNKPPLSRCWTKSGPHGRLHTAQRVYRVQLADRYIDTPAVQISPGTVWPTPRQSAAREYRLTALIYNERGSPAQRYIHNTWISPQFSRWVDTSAGPSVQRVNDTGLSNSRFLNCYAPLSAWTIVTVPSLIQDCETTSCSSLLCFNWNCKWSL